MDVSPAAGTTMLLVVHCRDSSRGLGFSPMTLAFSCPRPHSKGHTRYSKKPQAAERGFISWLILRDLWAPTVPGALRGPEGHRRGYGV